MTVFVLWENHATGPIHRFGPHAFLVACVAAQLQMERFELLRSERVMGRACNGNRNVLRDLAPGRPLWDAAAHLIAVLDTDKLHKLWDGESRRQVSDTTYDAWSAEMEARCRASLGPHEIDRLTICFLDRNLETLLETLGDISIEKDIVQRDKVLQRAAGDPALIRRALEQMPTWAHLVSTVARRIGPR